MQQKSWFWPSLAGLILVFLTVLLGYLALTDSLTTDEKAHLPAGVSYVTLLDSRLNPEHPPLMKIFTGLSVELFTHAKLPVLDSVWQGTNQQTEFADRFVSTNQSIHHQIIVSGRLPFICLTVVFGLLLYLWLSRRYSQPIGLIGLALYAFSPTIISHGHLVTFDVPAAFGYFITLISFNAFVYMPSARRATVAGLCLGVALLIKFSALLLIPILFLSLILWLLIRRPRAPKVLIWQFLFSLLISLTVVLCVYQAVTWHYPSAKNRSDILVATEGYGHRSIISLSADLAGNRLTQPLGQYLFGAILTAHRSDSGTPSYFLGQVTNSGDHRYFPVLLATKETLPTVIVLILGLLIVLGNLMFKGKKRSTIVWSAWLEENFTVCLIGITIVAYWVLAIISPLNIGYRHVLPTIPLLIILVCQPLNQWLSTGRGDQHWLRPAIIGGLIVWGFLELMSSYPYVLNYYNELAGGPALGYRVAVDSNYDWGQDLLRLAAFVKQNKITQLKLDYFGGDEPAVYLGSTYQHWQSNMGPVSGWFAISATIRQDATGIHRSDSLIGAADQYQWLSGQRPVAQIGSIFVYHLP